MSKTYSPSEDIVEQFLLHDSGPGESIILTFHRVKIFGCLFHPSKNFRFKMCELYLIYKYKNDTDFSIAVKMVSK